MQRTAQERHTVEQGKDSYDRQVGSPHRDHRRPVPEYGSRPADPIRLLRDWLDGAVKLGVREPRALATAEL